MPMPDRNIFFIVTANWWICIVESMGTSDLSSVTIVERDLRTENSCVIIRYSDDHVLVRCDALWFGRWVLPFWGKLKKKGQQFLVRCRHLSTKVQGFTSHTTRILDIYYHETSRSQGKIVNILTLNASTSHVITLGFSCAGHNDVCYCTVNL
jgi:hypothetical protein